MKNIVLKWGLIIALAGIILSLISRPIVGNDPEKMNKALGLVFGLITLSIWVAGFVMAMKEYRTEQGGYMAYGRGVRIGFLTSLAAGFILSAFTFIYGSYIDPSQIEKTKAMIEEKNEEIFDKNPQMTEKEKEKIVSAQMTFASPAGMAVSGFFFYAIAGGVLALIVSAVMKKSPPDGFMPNEFNQPDNNHTGGV